MKTEQEQIEEMANIKSVLIKTHKRCRTLQEDYMQDKYAEGIYKAGYRKASDVIDELVDKVLEKIRYEYKNYPNAMTVGTYYQLRKEINELADEMRQEVEK